MAYWQTLQSSCHQRQAFLEGRHQICLDGKDETQQLTRQLVLIQFTQVTLIATLKALKDYTVFFLLQNCALWNSLHLIKHSKIINTA